MKLKAKALLAGCVSGLLITAALPALAQQSTLRIALNADIRGTNPGVNRDDNTDAVVLHVVEGLVAYGEDASIQPLLAETFAISEDGRTYTFRLRKGVKFHNGAERDLGGRGRGAGTATWTRRRSGAALSEFDGRGRSKVEAVETPDAADRRLPARQADALFLATLARTDCAMTADPHKDSLKADGTLGQADRHRALQVRANGSAASSCG